MNPPDSQLQPNATAQRHDGGSRVIEIQTDRVDSLFEPYDPAPLEHRAISRNADAYVVDRFVELPHGKGAELRILLPADQANLCPSVQTAFRRHFAAAAARQQRLLENYMRDGFIMLAKSVVIAVLLVLASQSLAESTDNRILGKLANGLSLVVWVTMWRPVERLLFDWRPIRSIRDTYRKLAEINVSSEPIAD